MHQRDLKDRFAELYAKLKKLQEKHYERRAFLYLDILSWLQSKIEDKPVEEIIHRRFLDAQGFASTGEMLYSRGN